MESASAQWDRTNALLSESINNVHIRAMYCQEGGEMMCILIYTPPPYISVFILQMIDDFCSCRVS